MKNTMTQQESDLPSELARPAQRALYEAGYLRLEQLAKVSETELKQLHGIGPNAIKQLRRALGAKGLSFAEGKTSKDI
jgi:DNA repair protein RadC